MRVFVERIEQALVQVELGVGKGIAHGLLRAGEHNGFGAILNQVGKRCRGVAHGVGAVQNHEAVVVGITLDDDVADTHPVTGAHIGTVDVHRLHHVELAEARDLGDALGELLTGQGGGEAVAILGRCDGAARGDEKDALHAGIPYRICRRRGGAVRQYCGTGRPMFKRITSSVTSGNASITVK